MRMRVRNASEFESICWRAFARVSHGARGGRGASQHIDGRASRGVWGPAQGSRQYKDKSAAGAWPVGSRLQVAQVLSRFLSEMTK